MRTSKFKHMHAQMRQDTCELESTVRTGAWSYGPELLLVMISLLAVGMVAGVISAVTGTAMLAVTTGAVLTSLMTPSRSVFVSG